MAADAYRQGLLTSADVQEVLGIAMVVVASAGAGGVFVTEADGANVTATVTGAGNISITSLAGTLTVADTGDGISPDIRPRLFEPYVTTKPRGLGLGLAIARRIVEDHGERIEVASEPGRGSRFTVSLPLAGPPGA